MSEKANLFLNLKTFKDFYSEEVELICEYFSIHKFFDLQEIMPKTGRDTSFGVILSGEISIIEEHLENSTRTTGDFLGEMALLESISRQADFIAASDGTIAIMTFDDIENLKHKRPHLAVKLIHRVTQAAVEGIRRSGIRANRKYMILMADETKISELVNWVEKEIDILSNVPILAPEWVAQILKEKVNLSVKQVIRPNLLVGGSDTIGVQIILGNIKAVICLREPLIRRPNLASLEAIFRLCDTYQVICATNIQTARAILPTFT
ncbi:MAG: cyclic nucleotide-binding domain-containing protein [Limnoraphis sp. WC205]|jgi:methylglyoxal synthase|nr:cyclic nucleotide-binding domain-containing protein [Limnoraphis sp. WC205]